MKRKFLSLAAGLVLFMSCGVSGAEGPAGAVRAENIMEFIQRTHMFCAAADEQVGNKLGILLAAALMSQQAASLDVSKPLTLEVYISNGMLHPVLHGTLREGMNPVEIPFLTGQVLVPHQGKGLSVVYYEHAFSRGKELAKNSRTVFPEGDISSVYYFRDEPVKRGKSETQDDDFAKLLSGALEKIELSASYPGRNVLHLRLELSVKESNGLFAYTNAKRPDLKGKVQKLPKASWHVYAEIPRDAAFSNGFSVLLSKTNQDVSAADNIYNQFLNCVISDDHDSVISLSDNETCTVLSGLLPAGTQSRRNFEKFLGESCETFSDGIWISRGKNNEKIYVKFAGDAVTLLSVKQIRYSEELVVPIYETLRFDKTELTDRDFLVSMWKRPDGTYERNSVGSMSNGKFRLNVFLRPEHLQPILRSVKTEDGEAVLP